MIRLMTGRGRIALIVLCGGLLAASAPGCYKTSAKGDSPKTDAPKEEPKKERFAEDRFEVKAIPFDGKRAMEYLKALCDIGPRISGSEGMKKQQELLTKHFEKHGAKVTLQKFDGKQPSQKAAVPMANMIVTWHPETKRRVILCGHYDTRPIADQEPRERDWRKPFLSANDGTSTVALMMEMAHHMKDIPLQVGIDFIIFDAEEFIENPKADRFFLGSNHFASQLLKDQPKHTYFAGVLLDLFAGKDAVFHYEHHSAFAAFEVLQSIWKVAAQQGVKSFIPELKHEVLDDHIALNRVGIPTVDIIDFDYKHWHKLTDLPENCSGEKMAEVAKVLTAWWQWLK